MGPDGSRHAGALIVASALLATLAPCCGNDSDVEEVGLAPPGGDDGDAAAMCPDGGMPPCETPVTTLRVVTGYVTDVRTGGALGKAQVATIPPTETVVASDDGFYALQFAPSYGVIEVRAVLEGFEQRDRRCLNVSGLQTIGDVQLIRPSGSTVCEPACSAGTECVSGTCVPACNPACSCSEFCGPSGQCEPDPAQGKPDCGAHSQWAGGLLCTCDEGFVPDSKGTSCVAGPWLSKCPGGSTMTEAGCECPEGKTWSEDGTYCDLPTSLPLLVEGIAGTWAVPAAAPRGLAWDGRALWMADAASAALLRVTFDNGVQTGTVIESVGVGDLANRVADLAWSNDTLHILASIPGGQNGDKEYLRMRRPQDVIESVTASGLLQVTGLAARGDDLVVTIAEGDSVLMSSDGVLQTYAQCPISLLPGYPVPPTPHLLAIARSREIAWSETLFEQTAATVRLATGSVPVAAWSCGVKYATYFTQVSAPNRVVAGLEAAGDSLWILSVGEGTALPTLVEALLE